MTIRNAGAGEKVCTCDAEDCQRKEYSGTLDFSAFVADLKARDWRTVKAGDTWLHFCPDHHDDADAAREE